MKKYIGIDVGGMSIKGGLVMEDGTLIYSTSIETEPEKESDLIVKDIASLVENIIKDGGAAKSEIFGIGLGIPGTCDDEKGVVRYCCNINLVKTPIADMLSKLTGIKNIKISNDANCAALGETIFGAGQGAKYSVMFTLGTGLGTGIVVNGKILSGNKSAGGEGGHTQINMGGPICGCGMKGHLESYASATALVNQTKEAAKKHPESMLYKHYVDNDICGITPFDCAKAGDKVAIAVVNKYIKYVGIGLVNFANIFYPEVMIIGGGVSYQGDVLIKPLQKYINKNVFGIKYNPKIKVVAATLKNNAGIIGAAALCM